jgi:RNA-directed DNA polymerase
MRVSKDISWESVSWPLVRKRVFSLQRRIYEAKKSGNKHRLFFLQNKLINSLDAKLLSVLQVTSLNQGKKTPGVDKKVATIGKDKLEIVYSLSLNGNAQPIRRVWIDKPGKLEKRPLGIPTIRDRAKQALAKLALEPEWEAVFEPNSYGFRPGRCSHDAIEAIFLNLSKNIPKWVYDADIRKCFDTIDHGALLAKLDTFPKMEKQISAWLQAGVLEGYSNTSKEAEPTTQSTPQGGIVSPLLANIALHGLEHHLKEFVMGLPGKPLPTSNRGNAAKRKALGVVRYADDFVLTHGNKQILELCIQETRSFLSSMSLSISEEKSKLRDCREGFSFLGFRIIQIKRRGKYSVNIYPSRKNQAGILLKLRSIVQQGKSLSSYDLIGRLSPVLTGWARYYQYCECSEVFTKLQHLLFQKLRAWVFRRDRKNGRMAIKEKYFPSNKSYSYGGIVHNSNWTLVGQKKGKGSEIKTNFLPSMTWIPSKKFVKVAGTASPMDGNYVYWAGRSPNYSSSLRHYKLLKRQKNTCAICRRYFLPNDVIEVDHILPRNKGGKDVYANLQLLHKYCHIKKTASDALSR